MVADKELIREREMRIRTYNVETELSRRYSETGSAILSTSGQWPGTGNAKLRHPRRR